MRQNRKSAIGSDADPTQAKHPVHHGNKRKTPHHRNSFQLRENSPGADFTDRKEETARLVSNFKPLANTILISPRRWGKSSLVAKAASVAEQRTLTSVSAH